jgi:hypothetical protein
MTCPHCGLHVDSAAFRWQQRQRANGRCIQCGKSSLRFAKVSALSRSRERGASQATAEEAPALFVCRMMKELAIFKIVPIKKIGMTFYPDVMDDKARTRFWAQVAISGPDECWLYVGAITSRGYGAFGIKHPDGLWRTAQAHRVAYQLIKGRIPAGLILDHLCRTTACVNPSHLEPVTDAVNVVDRGTGVTARNAKKTHCNRGHPYTTANTYATKLGGRQCRLCRALIQRKLRKAQRKKRSGHAA